MEVEKIEEHPLKAGVYKSDRLTKDNRHLQLHVRRKAWSGLGISWELLFRAGRWWTDQWKTLQREEIVKGRRCIRGICGGNWRASTL